MSEFWTIVDVETRPDQSDQWVHRWSNSILLAAPVVSIRCSQQDANYHTLTIYIQTYICMYIIVSHCSKNVKSIKMRRGPRALARGPRRILMDFTFCEQCDKYIYLNYLSIYFTYIIYLYICIYTIVSDGGPATF